MQIRVIVYGSVQGVFFRHSARQLAQTLGLVGWIKNNPDGSVEAVAQGQKEKLVEFIGWCKKGPSLADVEKIEVDWKQVRQELVGFEILR